MAAIVGWPPSLDGVASEGVVARGTRRGGEFPAAASIAVFGEF